jgi:HAD superfamily hydrolase (TIGR01509 family)
MNRKLFIFDLDGVLVEACDWHRDALNLALKEVCNYTISQEDHIAIFNGIPTSRKLKILTDMGILPNSLHKIINDLKQEKTIEIIKRNAFIRHEKIEMIKKIKQKNHIVCCYTNSIRKTAELMLEKTGIKELFEIILTNQDVLNPKPDPEGYEYLIKKFNISKENTYIIEDSPKGLAAAQASGANVIKVMNANDTDINKIRRFL